MTQLKKHLDKTSVDPQIKARAQIKQAKKEDH